MATIELLADNQVVRINIPLIGRRVLALDCIPENTTPPFFEVSFVPDQLPVDELDLGGQCTISFDIGGLVYVVRANIDKVLSSQRLRLANVQSYSNMQKREYFRIDTEVSLIYQTADHETGREAPNTKVSLSGGGIRFPVDSKFRMRDKVDVKLCLKDFPEVDAECIGQVVRIDETHDGQMEIALSFVEISPQDRDKIISYCFAQQREQLRKRVQVKPDIET